MSMCSCQVLVIGGGLAGVSAAHHLHARCGVRDVVLIEAKDRLGGRAYTVKRPSGGKKDGGGVLEMGAQWIQGGCPANSMFNLCNR